MKAVGALLIASALVAAPLVVEGRTPAHGGAERRAILGALRPSIEAELGPSIEFVIDRLDVEQGWAFVQAEPQRRGGRQIDWRQYYRSDDWDHMDGLTVTAILQRSADRWRLAERKIGATDAWYCGRTPIKRIAKC